MGKIVKNGIEYGGAPLPIASSQVVGGVKVGNGLSIAPDGTLSAQGGGGGGASALNDLSDVTITDPSESETLVYNEETEEFENRQLNLSDLRRVDVDGAASGQVLMCQGNNRWRAGDAPVPVGYRTQYVSLLYIDGTAPSAPIVSLSTNGLPSYNGLKNMTLQLRPGITFSDGTRSIDLNGEIQIPISIERSSGDIVSVSGGNLDAVPVYGNYFNNPALFFIKGTCSYNSTQGHIEVTLTLNNHIVIFDADNSTIIPVSVQLLASAAANPGYTQCQLIY